jgi:hypothetical protein
MVSGLGLSQLRTESRITAVLPVKISPQNEPNRARPACTCEISTRGAKLMKLDGIGEGDILWIVRNARRAKFRVVWIGTSGSERDGQIGVESLEPEKFIWDDDLRGKLAEASK